MDNKKKQFKPIHTLKKTTLETSLKFAYDMTFGKNGEHRNHRTGGIYLRKNGEIFANTFQGKLSEFAVYNTLYKDFITNQNLKKIVEIDEKISELEPDKIEALFKIIDVLKNM